MKRYSIISSIIVLSFLVSTHLISQSLRINDLALVGSLIDDGAIFPQQSGMEYGLLFRSSIELNNNSLIQLDGSYARVTPGLNAYLVASRYNFRTSKRLLSGAVGYVHLDPFKSYFISCDHEFFANDLLTITTGLLYEIKNLFQNQYAFDFSFQIYFTDHLMMRSGVAFTGENISRPLFEAILAVEYLPKALPISFYFQLGNELVFQNQFGLRYNFGQSKNLKERHRDIIVSTRFL